MEVRIKPGLREIGHLAHAPRTPQKFRPQRRHGEGGTGKLDAIGKDTNRVGSVPQDVPVKEQAEAVVSIITTDAAGIGAAGAVGSLERRPVVETDSNPGSAGKDSMKSTTYVPTRFDGVADPISIRLGTAQLERANERAQQLFHLMSDRPGS